MRIQTNSFAERKRFLRAGEARVAFYEEGDDEPLLFLHGCPFSSYIWRKVIPRLSPDYRCLAPDLMGLGDTETSADADWSLPAQASMTVEFLDALEIDRTHVVGHDHGGAVAQLLAAEHPNRIQRLVLTNSEAYDNWPSDEERPLVRLTQVPLLGDVILWGLSRRPILRFTLAMERAVHDPGVLSPELLEGYIRANFSDRHRREKTKRFLARQLNPKNNRTTLDLLDGLRGFDHPTLLIWGENDPHFGPEWGKRLYVDIPGAVRLELLSNTGHLLMEEHPHEVATSISDFLSEPIAESAWSE